MDTVERRITHGEEVDVDRLLAEVNSPQSSTGLGKVSTVRSRRVIEGSASAVVVDARVAVVV